MKSNNSKNLSYNEYPENDEDAASCLLAQRAKDARKALREAQAEQAMVACLLEAAKGSEAKSSAQILPPAPYTVLWPHPKSGYVLFRRSGLRFL